MNFLKISHIHNDYVFGTEINFCFNPVCMDIWGALVCTCWLSLIQSERGRSSATADRGSGHTPGSSPVLWVGSCHIPAGAAGARPHRINASVPSLSQILTDPLGSGPLRRSLGSLRAALDPLRLVCAPQQGWAGTLDRPVFAGGKGCVPLTSAGETHLSVGGNGSPLGLACPSLPTNLPDSQRYHVQSHSAIS